MLYLKSAKTFPIFCMFSLFLTHFSAVLPFFDFMLQFLSHTCLPGLKTSVLCCHIYQLMPCFTNMRDNYTELSWTYYVQVSLPSLPSYLTQPNELEYLDFLLSQLSKLRLHNVHPPWAAVLIEAQGTVRRTSVRHALNLRRIHMKQQCYPQTSE